MGKLGVGDFAEIDPKSASLARGGFYTHPPAHALYTFLHNGQADASAWEFAAMEAVE